jgi:hypothetical protein
MDSNGLGKLLPKAIARRRKKKDADVSADGADNVNRGRTSSSRETFESDGTASTKMADEGEESFASHESDPES